MTIAAGKTPYHKYTPGSGMSAEAIPFEFLDPAHLVVRVVNGEELTVGSHYEIGGSWTTGAGTIRALVDAGSDEWELFSNTPDQQQLELRESRVVPLRQYEKELDRAAIRARENNFDLRRAPKVPRDETIGGLPSLVRRKGNLLGATAPVAYAAYDSDGNPTVDTPENFAAPAAASEVAARMAAAFAEEFSGPAYASQAAGEAATTTGQFFRVWNGDTPRTYTRYERTAGGSVVADPLATTSVLRSTESGEGAGLSGFSPAADYDDGTAGKKLQQIKAVADYPTPAVADAEATDLYVSEDVTTTVANGAALASRYSGPGRVTTADGNRRGKFFTAVKSAPAVTGNSDSIDTAYNGDFSSPFVIEHRVSGLGTLGTPATGYLYRNEAMPIYGVMYVASDTGHNTSLSGNGGRTGVAFSRLDVKHYGNGDAVCYNGSVFIAGNKTGATSWLAQPAGVLFNGDMSCGTNYVYMNPREIHLSDNGFDVACVGDVANFNRTNAAGAQGTTWIGYRPQSVGSVPCDSILSATGLWKNGIDLSMSFLDFGANKAAVSLKGGDRIYLNNASSNDIFTTFYNGDWIGYEPGAGAILIVRAGVPVVQVAPDRATFTKPIVHPTTTVSGLPAAASENAGMEYYVTDAAATTRLATVVGGGANFVKVFSNGINWLIL